MDEQCFLTLLEFGMLDEIKNMPDINNTLNYFLSYICPITSEELLSFRLMCHKMPYVLESNNREVHIICTDGTVVATRSEIKNNLITSELFKEENKITIHATTKHVMQMFEPLHKLNDDYFKEKRNMDEYAKLVVQIILRDAFGKNHEDLDGIIPIYIYTNPNSPIIDIMRRYNIACYNITSFDITKDILYGKHDSIYTFSSKSESFLRSMIVTNNKINIYPKCCKIQIDSSNIVCSYLDAYKISFMKISRYIDDVFYYLTEL